MSRTLALSVVFHNRRRKETSAEANSDRQSGGGVSLLKVFLAREMRTESNQSTKPAFHMFS